ncbi:MAG: hypothetical protein IJZ13_02420, partial [Clostridia bacterium]|nr:hypothetical protein [Clostridia bacterium]
MSKGKRIVSGVLVLCLCLLSGCGLTGPEAVMSAFEKATQAGDGERYVSLLSQSLLAELSGDPAEMEPQPNFSLSDIRRLSEEELYAAGSADGVAICCGMLGEGEGALPMYFHMIREDGGWKIDYASLSALRTPTPTEAIALYVRALREQNAPLYEKVLTDAGEAQVGKTLPAVAADFAMSEPEGLSEGEVRAAGYDMSATDYLYYRVEFTNDDKTYPA